jgi:hypothetical protein
VLSRDNGSIPRQHPLVHPAAPEQRRIALLAKEPAVFLLISARKLLRRQQDYHASRVAAVRNPVREAAAQSNGNELRINTCTDFAREDTGILFKEAGPCFDLLLKTFLVA